MAEITPKLPFTLTHEDKASALWKKLMNHWEERLHTFRIQNDGDKSEVETAKLRGRIAEIRTAMALNNDPIKE